jgi:RNA polymerase sigma factor (sigma-70 family)
MEKLPPGGTVQGRSDLDDVAGQPRLGDFLCGDTFKCICMGHKIPGHAIDDLRQDLYLRLAGWFGHAENPYALVSVAALRMWIDVKDKVKRRATTSFDPSELVSLAGAGPNPEPTPEKFEIVRDLAEKIARELSDRQREVFVMRQQEMTTMEIADILGVSLGRVRNLDAEIREKSQRVLDM